MGASTTVISQATFRLIQQRNQIDLRPSKVRLKTYTGHAIPIVGCATLQARYDKQQSDVVIQLVTGDGPNLLGRDMLQKLEVDIGSIQCIHTTVLHKPTPLDKSGTVGI